MREIIIAEIESMYREPLVIKGYVFGSGEKTLCIIGSMRGNEYSQLFTCSQLVKDIKELEGKGQLADNCEILVIPTINNYSMNVFKRFWTVDNTDINRMFPGYEKGETTQRIAAVVFEAVREYKYAVQFASYFLDVDFLPHVRVMKTGYENTELAQEFKLPYAVIREPKPYDTTTLNYNLQIFGVHAFSIYTSTNDSIQEKDILMAKEAVIRFMDAHGMVSVDLPPGYDTKLINYEYITSIRSTRGGLFRKYRMAGSLVKKGDLLAEIIDPMIGETKELINAPRDGIVFFVHGKLIISSHSVVVKLI